MFCVIVNKTKKEDFLSNSKINLKQLGVNFTIQGHHWKKKSVKRSE